MGAATFGESEEHRPKVHASFKSNAAYVVSVIWYVATYNVHFL